MKDPDDLNIYAFENVSHVPTIKLIKIFNINIKKDPHLLEGYFLTKKRYKKHKKYIKKNMAQINLKVFEYCLRQYAGYDFEPIRKHYKEDLME